jgi:sulfur carrier protein
MAIFKVSLPDTNHYMMDTSDTLQLYLNGELRQFANNTRISTLTQQLGLEQQRYAVEVNRCIVPKSVHASYVLKQGDRVEIIQAMGGG